MPNTFKNNKMQFIPALALPVALVLSLAFGIIYFADRFLNHSLNAAILGYAEENATSWAQKVIERQPELIEVATGERVQLTSLDWIMQSAQTNNIFRFKLFSPDGQLLIVSDEPTFIAEASEIGVSTLVRNVFLTGSNNSTINDGSQKANRPDAYVETYIQATSPDGTPFGVIEVYVDVTDLSFTFHSIFHALSRILIIGSAIAYLIPSLFLVFRGEKIRGRDRALMHLSLYDPLTNTLNRRAFSPRCQALFDTRLNDEIGVIFIDLDRFKEVNDSLGHEFGDRLLEHTGTLLNGCLGEDDFIGRFGGDEFIILLPHTNQEALLIFSERIKESLTQGFSYRGSTIALGASIGIHLSGPGEDEERARHSADLALYRAKANGRGQIVQFSPDLDEDLLRRRHVEASMRRSLAGHGGFFINFQPIFRSNGVTLAGFEALLRLRDEAGESISPTEFIPIAEESGLINQIGYVSLRCILETACGWPKDQFLAVNLSAVQFKDGKLVENVKALLEETGFDPARLNLEVTESLLIEDEEQVSWQLAGLQELGASISLDDFGTGYSSLGYLWKFGFDNLKIDRAFLKGFDHSSEKFRQVIATIVMLGHNLGMSVTVEGVESEAQFSMMKELGCDHFQGFLLGRPMAEAEALELAVSETVSQRSA